MIYFTSDEHYGHLNIIKFCNRPFATLEEQTETIIARHNERVKAGDLVYHLGDMFWRHLTFQQCMDIRDRLNGQHYYVWGNHEELMEAHPALRARFIWRKDLVQITPPGYPKAVLCHYAMRVWRGSHRGVWQLYGHTHAQLPETDALSCDVGVDAWNYYPVSIEEIAAKMASKRQVTQNRQLDVMYKSRFDKSQTQ